MRWGLHYEVEAVKLQPCGVQQRLPNLLWAPILKWLGHRKLNLTLLTLGPPTTSCLGIHPRHTTPPFYSDTRLAVATAKADLHILIWVERMEDVAGHSKEWKGVRKKAEISVWGGGEENRKKNACGDSFLYCFPVSWSGGRRKQEQAMQPANFKPINCKWDNYCRCFILAAGITWFKSAAACCFWWVMCNVMFHIHLLCIRRRNYEEFILFEEKLLHHTWGEKIQILTSPVCRSLAFGDTRRNVLKWMAFWYSD